MTFWNSSAVVPLLVRQESSPVAEGWIAEDPDMVLTLPTLDLRLGSAAEREGFSVPR
jgi:hypothetical protein